MTSWFQPVPSTKCIPLSPTKGEKMLPVLQAGSLQNEELILVVLNRHPKAADIRDELSFCSCGVLTDTEGPKPNF